VIIIVMTALFLQRYKFHLQGSGVVVLQQKFRGRLVAREARNGHSSPPCHGN
jgi:hypothetical protein